MTYSAGVVSVLPLYYVGWSDSILSPSELSSIRQHVQTLPHLTDADRQTLTKWANPQSPPSNPEFEQWVLFFKQNTDIFDQNLNLVDLGIAMAQKISENVNLSDPAIRASLLSFQAALRVDNEKSKQVFYQKFSGHISASTDTFNTQKLRDILDGPFAKEKRKAIALMQDLAFDVPIDLRDKDKLRLRILDQVKLLAEQGFGAYAFPKEYGGHASPGGSSALFEGMAYGNLSLLIKFGVQFGLFGGAIYLLGTERHHKYLAATGKAELLGCFAMTETGHGSNVKDLETTAVYKDGFLVINSPTIQSGKEYIGNALHAEMAAVFVQLIVSGQNHGIHAVLVPIRESSGQLMAGIKVEDCGYKIGLNGVDNGRIWFDHVKVPVENLLNKYGGIDEKGTYQSTIDKPSKRFFTMLGALVGGRVSISAGSNAAAKKSLAIAIKYALKRRQFAGVEGSPETLIMDYPSHQERLIPLLAKSYALSFAIEDLRSMFHKDYLADDKREIETLAAGLKSYASWHATKTIQTCREACGGKGYLSENQIGDLKADTEIFTTFEGDNTVLMQLVAKAVLTDLKQDFNEGGFPAIYRHILKRLANSWLTQNPFTSQNASAEHILDLSFMAEAFSFREEKLLFSLSDRMRSFMKKKLDPNEIFMRVQTHMLSLAHAHIERRIFLSFEAKLNHLADSPEKTALNTMLQAFALDAIYAERGWYLENEFMSGEKSKAIRKVLSHLWGKIRTDVELYVAAFGIPDDLLNAAILKDQVKSKVP